MRALGFLPIRWLGLKKGNSGRGGKGWVGIGDLERGKRQKEGS